MVGVGRSGVGDREVGVGEHYVHARVILQHRGEGVCEASGGGGAWKSEGTTPCTGEIFIPACPNRPKSRARAGLARLKHAFERWLPPYNGHVGKAFLLPIGAPVPIAPTVHSTATFSAEASLV